MRCGGGGLGGGGEGEVGGNGVEGEFGEEEGVRAQYKQG